MRILGLCRRLGLSGAHRSQGYWETASTVQLHVAQFHRLGVSSIPWATTTVIGSTTITICRRDVFTVLDFLAATPAVAGPCS